MMAIQANEKTDIAEQKLALPDNAHFISFKAGYLDNLVEAEALLEVLGKMINHHEDINMNSKAFMGMSILLEKITQLIDVNENLLNDSNKASN